MRILPKYPKNVTQNPFYTGIIVGFVSAIGYTMTFFSTNMISLYYGIGLMTIGIIFYYYKHKEYDL